MNRNNIYIRTMLFIALTAVLLAPITISHLKVNATPSQSSVYTGTPQGASPDPSFPCDTTKTVLLIQDSVPWFAASNQNPNGADVNELIAQNRPFCMITSNQISTTSLTQFKEILIPSAQNSTYYNNLFPSGTISPAIANWVQNGGVLSANLADCASGPGNGAIWGSSPPSPSGACTSSDATSYTFVAGVKHTSFTSDENDISTSTNPIVTGQFGGSNSGQIADGACFSDLDCWTSSSHSYFTNLPSSATTILTEASTGNPVLIQYRYGSGLVLATTTSVEWRYSGGGPLTPGYPENLKLLANEIGYQHFLATCPGQRGNGHFHGNNGNGNFSFCTDPYVSSTDRGDGRDFSSTQINSIKFDPIADTVTMTGIGTSAGLPVAFTFVALETGLTTPGWVSFAFSDGYTNAGTLTNGIVQLH